MFAFASAPSWFHRTRFVFTTFMFRLIWVQYFSSLRSFASSQNFKIQAVKCLFKINDLQVKSDMELVTSLLWFSVCDPHMIGEVRKQPASLWLGCFCIFVKADKFCSSHTSPILYDWWVSLSWNFGKLTKRYFWLPSLTPQLPTFEVPNRIRVPVSNVYNKWKESSATGVRPGCSRFQLSRTRMLK